MWAETPKHSAVGEKEALPEPASEAKRGREDNLCFSAWDGVLDIVKENVAKQHIFCQPARVIFGALPAFVCCTAEFCV